MGILPSYKKRSRGLTMLRDGLCLPLSFTLGGMFLLSLWGTDMTYFFAAYFVAAVSYLELTRRLLQFRPFSKRELAGLFAFGLALRIMFLRLPTTLSTDVISYFRWAENGVGFVPGVENFFVYPPAFGYLLKLLSIFQVTPLAFRGLMIVADVLTAYLIRRLTMTLWHSDKAGNLAAVAYLFLPPAILESGWNGHFEPLVNSVALIALVLSAQQKSIRAGVGSAVAIGLKAYPALFAIGDVALLSRRGRKKFTLSLFLTLSLIVAPVAYYGGVSSVANLLHRVTTVPTGGLGRFSQPMYLGGIFQYLAGSSIALVQYMQLISAVGVGIALIIALNVRKWCRSIVLMLLAWLGGLAELYGFVRFAEYNGANPVIVYWFVPPAINLSFAVLFVVAGALLVVGVNRVRIERSRLRLLFIGLSLAGAIAVMNFGILEGWYIFFFLPLALVTMPRRYLLPLIMFSLVLYPAPYTSSNFQTIGAAANTVSIVPTSLHFTPINHLGPDLTASGFNISWMKANASANQGELKFIGQMACFMTNSPYTYSFYSLDVDVNESQYPFLILRGNSSLMSLRIEFWNNGKDIASDWVPEPTEEPRYVDTYVLTGNTSFNRLVIVNLKPHGEWQCLDDLKFVPGGGVGTASTVIRGTSLDLVSDNGYAGLLMNVTRSIRTSEILTLDLETNYNPVLEIGVLYKDSQHNEIYSLLSREYGILNNFSYTPYSMSLSGIRNTMLLGIIIKAYPLNIQNSTHSVLVKMVQFSEVAQGLNIVTLVGAAAALCALLTVSVSLSTENSRDRPLSFDSRNLHFRDGVFESFPMGHGRT